MSYLLRTVSDYPVYCAIVAVTGIFGFGSLLWGIYDSLMPRYRIRRFKRSGAYSHWINPSNYD